ncbi:MAG: circadian clock KaiB family protein [Rhodospirillaceae bacterium]
MKCCLRLYITGGSLVSQHAVVNLHRFCEDEQCDYEIIDVLKNPELAEQEKILATPTLVRRFPAPVRKVIGDLSQRDRVVLGLGLETLKIRRINGLAPFGDAEEKESGI